MNETNTNYSTLISTLGTSVPTASKRRIKQTLQLSRKLMELQRINQELTKQLEEEKLKVQQLSDELMNCNDLISKTQQPYGFLIENLRERDKAVQHHLFIISEMEKDLTRIKSEKV